MAETTNENAHEHKHSTGFQQHGKLQSFFSCICLYQLGH